MRQKRAKIYKRVMALYVQTFSFRSPFQILVSNDLIVETNRDSDLYKQLGACVQGEVKPMITQCCIEALYKLGKEYQGFVDIAKSFERRRCNHRETLEPDACLIDVVGPTNKHRYIVAAQSTSLRTNMNTIPGLPMLHFNPRGVLVLSPPSQSTLKHKVLAEEERRRAGAEILKDVKDGANVVASSSGSGSVSHLQRSRVKAPNPLSVRKKKVEKVVGVDAGRGEGKGKKQVEGKEDRQKRAREEDVGEKEGANGVDVNAEEHGKWKTKKRKRKARSAVKDAIIDLNAAAATQRESGTVDSGRGDSNDGDSD